jgi:hypothetical protein
MAWRRPPLKAVIVPGSDPQESGTRATYSSELYAAFEGFVSKFKPILVEFWTTSIAVSTATISGFSYFMVLFLSCECGEGFAHGVGG